MRQDGTKIPYDKEKGEFRVGLITKNRTLVLNYSTKHPKVELRLGTGQYFTGYNADSDEPYYLKGASMDGNSYQIGMMGATRTRSRAITSALRIATHRKSWQRLTSPSGRNTR